MVCPKCGCSNVQVQVVNNVTIKNKHHSIIWWLFWGWYWVPIKWLFFTLPAILVKLFCGKKQKIISKQQKVCICQNCGNSWNI